MHNRTSQVGCLSILSIDDSSILEIGDSKKVNPAANVIAVQREPAIFFEHEFNFRDYTIFQERIPQPQMTEDVISTTFHRDNTIHVNKVEVSFMAAASVVHIGSSNQLSLEARIKNIRHLLREK